MPLVPASGVRGPIGSPASPAAADALRAFVARHRRLFVLTGAGISTDSGIPCYRDAAGVWQRSPPVLARDFIADHAVRQRYWARSMIGWPRIAAAHPNGGHAALARLEALGLTAAVVTQNVDGLHQRAGSVDPIELHGSLQRVICLGCGQRAARSSLQQAFERANPGFVTSCGAAALPDGDASLTAVHCAGFCVPDCSACGGMLKPDVVFFGEGVPRERVAMARDGLATADAMLVIGSSLMVYSGYRFCEWAVAGGKPIAIVNQGRTRADHLADLKIDGACTAILGALADGA
ncbi:MAG: NAD-dependent protein deacetylase, partial [Casimicrobiaceae bacterium]